MEEKIPKELEDAFKKTFDPEIGNNLYDSGIIHDVKVEGKTVHLKLALPLGCLGCGVMQMLIEDLKKNIKEAGYEPDIQIG